MLISVQNVVYSLAAVGLYGVFDLARRYYRWQTSPLRKLPGPPRPSFLIGYFWQIFREPFMSPHKRWWESLREKYGHVPFMCYSSLFGRYSVIVLDADVVKLILMDSSAREPVRFPKNYFFIREITGDGLVVLEGKAWSRHRRIISPAFQTSALRDALNRSVPYRTKTLIESWRKAEGCTIDVSSHMSALTLDVIGDVAFSHDFAATRVIEKWAEAATINGGQQQELEDVADPLVKAFNESFRISILSIIFALLNLSWLEQKYLNRKAIRTRRLLNEAVDNIIHEARKKGQEEASDQSDKHKVKSLLQILFEAADTEPGQGRGKTLSDLELRDETKTFVVAGHETTSTWCCWALYALAKYPDVQQKVYKDVLAHAPDSSSPITLEDVENMPYLWAFLSEVLRLYPPAGMIIRFTSQEERFDKYTFPAKTRLVVPIHLLHRHPDHWKSPDDFRPERWLDKEENEARHRFCYLPFSAGGRSCVGQRFAEIEAKLIVANIVRAFTIELAPCMRDKEITFTNFITMKSKPPVKICVRTRQ